jgi:hypothetical protein
MASRHRELFLRLGGTKDRFGETPKPARETRALPRASCIEKWRALSRFKPFVRVFTGGIQAAGPNVFFDLPVPFVGREFRKPFAKLA